MIFTTTIILESTPTLKFLSHLGEHNGSKDEAGAEWRADVVEIAQRIKMEAEYLCEGGQGPLGRYVFVRAGSYDRQRRCCASQG